MQNPYQSKYFVQGSDQSSYNLNIDSRVCLLISIRLKVKEQLSQKEILGKQIYLNILRGLKKKTFYNRSLLQIRYISFRCVCLKYVIYFMRQVQIFILKVMGIANIRLRDHLIFHRYLWFLAGSSKVQQTFNFKMPYYLNTLFDLNSDAICKCRR